MKLSRRDRAALVLALECLRRFRLDRRRLLNATTALRLAREAMMLADDSEGATALWYALRTEAEGESQRPARARAALLIRAILRADALATWDAFEPFTRPQRFECVCTGCGENARGYGPGERMRENDLCPVTGRVESGRLPVPLWARAR